MIKRIVKMSFHPEHIEAFISIFRENWQQIRHFEGCTHVELLQHEGQTGTFFTYSHWHSEDHLNNYRNSELFATVWGATKQLFNARPEAWTVKQLMF
jgi:heme oxygenase (mycobilin-producing)